MNKSSLFKQAHKMTKAVIQKGDDYRVTFGLCLKAIKGGYKMTSKKAKQPKQAVKKTEESIQATYGATDRQAGFAADNALVTMQDKYGYETVTDAFLSEKQAEWLEWFESSIAAIVEEANPKFM